MAFRKVAFLGFGEVGTAMAKGLAERGIGSPDILLADPAFDSPRGERMKAAAERLGATIHSSTGPWLAEADLVVSAATGKLAMAVARSALPHLRAKQVYADVNTATPESMRQVSEILAAAQVVFVDVAIMGAIETHQHRAPMLAAGEGAIELENGLTPFGFRIRSIAGAAGDASAVKLLRSVFTKGLEALCVESFVAATRFGMASQMLENLLDFEEAGFAETIRMLVTTHCRHARRRLDEVRSLSGLFAEAGISPVMTNAAQEVFRRTVDSTVPEWAAGVASPSFDECLSRLLAIARPPEAEPPIPTETER